MRANIDSRADRYEMARTDTTGLERAVQSRRVLRDREAAEKWERERPEAWRARLVCRGCTAKFWVWWLQPSESGNP